MNTPKLTNDRQKDFFNQLKKRKTPSCMRNLYMDPLEAQDFLQAFMWAVHMYSHRQEFLLKLLATIRAKAMKMDNKQIEEYVSTGFERMMKGEIELSMYVLPFSVREGDTDGACKVLNRLIEWGIPEGKDLIKGSLSSFLLILLCLIASLEMSRTWNLVTKGVYDRKEQAIEVFNKILGVFAILTIGPSFVSARDRKFINFDGSVNLDKLIFGLKGGSSLQEVRITEIPVGDLSTARACNAQSKKLARERDDHYREMLEFVSWFGSHEKYFQDLAQKFWRDIMDNPRVGLNPSGRDVISVQVSSLRDEGYKYLQLIPNVDKPFPAFCLRVWIAIPYLERRVVIEHKMNAYDRLKGVIGGEGASDFNALVDKLQQFMGLHCFWRIITGREVKTRPKKTWSSERRRNALRRKFTGFRPHFRWLPPGYQASDTAIEKSLAVFQQAPPPGKTFVKMREDIVLGEMIVPGKDVSTVLVYTDDDLGYSPI